MWFRSLLDVIKIVSVKPPAQSAQRDAARRRPGTRRLQVEGLEDRRLLAFVPFGAYAVGTSPQSVVAADFNNDGRLDLATLNNSEYLSYAAGVILGAGDGTYGDAIQTPLGIGLFSDQQLEWDGWLFVAGDFNGDGNADLATTYTVSLADNPSAPGYYFTQVSVYQGRGDGSFHPARSAYESWELGTAIMRAADVNGDGRSDIALDGPSYPEHPGSYVLLLGNPDGSFTETRGDQADFPQAVPDVNGDGFGDAVSSDANVDAVVVQFGRPDGTLTPWQESPRYPVGRNPVAVTMGDFNGDGRIDVAAASHYFGSVYSGSVSVLLNDGDWPPGDAPAVRIGDVTVIEGHAGTANATFTVTLSVSSRDVVTVQYATADGTATAGSDYQAASGTLTFAPGGETQKTITVAVLGDLLFEPNETFTVNLSNPTGAVIVDGSGIGTILNDDSQLPSINISDVTKKEGNGKKTTAFLFTVTLSAAYDQPVTMSYRTVDGTATTGDDDYVAKTGTLTFVPGETTKTITISVKGDSKREASETFYLDLFGLSTNASFTKNRGLGTILNDDS